MGDAVSTLSRKNTRALCDCLAHAFCKRLVTEDRKIHNKVKFFKELKKGQAKINLKNMRILHDDDSYCDNLGWLIMCTNKCTAAGLTFSAIKRQSFISACARASETRRCLGAFPCRCNSAATRFTQISFPRGAFPI